MGKLVCVFIGHDWRRSKFKSLNSIPLRDKFICLRCGKNDNRPRATFYTPMDIPPLAPKPLKEGE